MPNAPAPRFNGHGHEVTSWGVNVQYDPVRDIIICSWWGEANAYDNGRVGSETFGPSEVEDALAQAQRQARIQAAPRLF